MKALNKKIKFIVEKTSTGYSAFTEDYPVFTTANTIPELLNNTLEAASLYFEEKDLELTAGNIKLEIDFQQFFQYYSILNARVLADRIGMNRSLLSQYVQGKKKPSAKQTARILAGIHQVGRELSEIRFIYEE
jgi:predicted RNase H-like HicB family nuclease